MEVIKIPLIQLFVDEDNIREDIGDLEDLTESIIDVGENIFPLAVQLVGNKYKIIHGKRRFHALKQADSPTANCFIVNPNDFEKFKLMYYENLGRKDLTWTEELKALKKFKEFCKEIKTTKFVEDTSKRMHKTKRTIWRIFKLIDALEEYPELANEQSRSAALIKYETIKQLDKDKQKQIKEKKISIDKALDVEKVQKTIKKENDNNKVISELKKEVDYYKNKFSDIRNIIKEIKKIDYKDRIECGIWFEDELIGLVDAARTCESFGIKKGMTTKICNKCKEEMPDEYRKCEFWHNKFNK